MRKKLYVLLFSFILFKSSFAQQTVDTTIRSAFIQTLSQKEKDFQIGNLYLLGKVWGFLKYYHPAVAGGKYNWDNELVTFLTTFYKARSVNERNGLLESWIDKFGNVPVCTTCNDSALKNAKLKPDFSWINETSFSKPLAQKLRFIQNNRVQKDFYYVKADASEGVNLVQFQHEQSYSNLVFPNDSYGLLSLFRFWNIVEYWYPYKYNLPESWDDVLKTFIPKMLTHRSAYDYTITMEELITAIHDSHGYFRSPLTDETLGKFYMPFTVRLVENKLLVTSILNDSLASLSDVNVGDIIEKIEGAEVFALVKQFTATCPVSNAGSLLDKMSYRLTRTNNRQNNLLIQRNGSSIKTVVYNYMPKLYPPVDLNPPYFSYQKDSAFCMLDGNIGYINVGVFKRADSLQLKAFVSKAKSLIIDNRQNQDEMKGTGGGDIIGELVMPEQNAFARFSTAQPTYPGVFTLTAPTNMGTSGSKNCFRGNIIILINESTISVGEFLTMAFQTAPHARSLGTTTSGADGNITYIILPGNFTVYFTGLGVYYPNGKETQRVGISPDIVVKQSIHGYLNNEDEQLMRAIDYLRKEDR